MLDLQISQWDQRIELVAIVACSSIWKDVCVIMASISNYVILKSIINRKMFIKDTIPINNQKKRCCYKGNMEFHHNIIKTP